MSQARGSKESVASTKARIAHHAERDGYDQILQSERCEPNSEISPVPLRVM
jgi:hypothetical protein